jgi:hypothetical protein
LFKRYECGCIGFVLNGGAVNPDDKRIWLVKACDNNRDDPEYGFGYSAGRRSTLAHKPSTKLSDAEIERIFRDLGDLIADGYKFRDLKAILS